LFAALVSRLAEMDGANAVDAIMEPFEKSAPPFILSSLFPRAGSLYFFPVPAARGKREFKEVFRIKNLKKVRFLLKSFFESNQRRGPRGFFPEVPKIAGWIYSPSPKKPGMFLHRCGKKTNAAGYSGPPDAEIRAVFHGRGSFYTGLRLWMTADIREPSCLSRLKPC
jgi:hypothetical protein